MERNGRPLRIKYPGTLSNITSRGDERHKISFNDPDMIKFLGILEDYHEGYGILIHTYILITSVTIFWVTCFRGDISGF